VSKRPCAGGATYKTLATSLSFCRLVILTLSRSSVSAVIIPTPVCMRCATAASLRLNIHMKNTFFSTCVTDPQLFELSVSHVRFSAAVLRSLT